jgi:2-polyprenyl-3-methyl-5-hydroxy-6-metoxy-1,4-benzoquinol methylase
MMENYKFLDKCRLCFKEDLKHVLHLTPTPPANEFVKEPVEQETFPLDLLECQNCGHVQLSCVVDPNILFKNYVYVSGTSKSFVKHFEDYASKMVKDLELKEGSTICDIGSNDGTLLKAFQNLNMKCVGVDPAENIAKEANQNGITTIVGFFNSETSKDVKKYLGEIDLVTANNVFAHADDLHQIVRCVKQILSDEGVFVFEVSYLLDMINKKTFDLLYHEHLSEHHLGPLVNLFKQYGMTIFNVERIETHGGSIRVYVSNSHAKRAFYSNFKIIKLLEEENKAGLRIGKNIARNYNIILNKASAFLQFSENISDLKNKLCAFIEDCKNNHINIIAYGAPAKVTTLLYHFGLTKNNINYIVDDSILKQNLYTPGLHIPVKSSEYMLQDLSNSHKKAVIITAWNFAKDIIRNNRDLIVKYNLICIVPLPKFVLIYRENIDDYLKG